MQKVLDCIRIVLVGTSHSGNIGSTARAMKNMGLRQLVLVQPKAEINAEAISMASGADDILAAATIVDDLATAIAPCSLVLGASARSRRLESVCKTSRECVADIVAHSGQQVAVVFGSEHSGLTNEELNMCQIHVHIPTDPNFSSLNLSQAVQVLCYEIYYGLAQENDKLPQPRADVELLATSAEVDGVQQHFTQVMQTLEFMNPAQPKKIAQRLRRILYKAELEKSEVNILRGFLSAVEKNLP